MRTAHGRLMADGLQRLLAELWLRLLAGARHELGDHEVDEFVRPVCAMAHAGGLLQEELIAAVRTSWGARHELCASPGERSRLERILADVVSACAESYGADGAGLSGRDTDAGMRRHG